MELFGVDMPVRIACVIALVILGWALARDIGRALGPILFKRLDPGTAGTLGFLIRLFTVVARASSSRSASPGSSPRRSPSVVPSPRCCSDSPRSRRSGT